MCQLFQTCRLRFNMTGIRFRVNSLAEYLAILENNFRSVGIAWEPKPIIDEFQNKFKPRYDLMRLFDDRHIIIHEMPRAFASVPDHPYWPGYADQTIVEFAHQLILSCEKLIAEFLPPDFPGKISRILNLHH